MEEFCRDEEGGAEEEERGQEFHSDPGKAARDVEEGGGEGGFAGGIPGGEELDYPYLGGVRTECNWGWSRGGRYVQLRTISSR